MDNGKNGDVAFRDHAGRFTKGNPGGPGPSRAKQIVALRKAFLEATTEEQIHDVQKTLFTLAVAGNVEAIKEFLARAIGRAPSFEEIETLEREAGEGGRRRTIAFEVDAKLMELLERGAGGVSGSETQRYGVLSSPATAPGEEPLNGAPGN